MVNGWDLLQATLMLKRLWDRYEKDPTVVACDLLQIIARAATHHKVPLQKMLDAVRAGAKL